jgi:hypothetical protein
VVTLEARPARDFGRLCAKGSGPPLGEAGRVKLKSMFPASTQAAIILPCPFFGKVQNFLPLFDGDVFPINSFSQKAFEIKGSVLFHDILDMLII